MANTKQQKQKKENIGQPQSGSLRESANQMPNAWQTENADAPPTKQNLDNMLSSMSTDDRLNLAYGTYDYAIGNKPDALYGYGLPARDFSSQYDTPAERPEGYSTIYDYLEDEGLGGWADQQNPSPREMDAVSQLLRIAQNKYEYDKERDIDNYFNDQNNRKLYGDTLADLVAENRARQQAAEDEDLIRQARRDVQHQQHIDSFRPRERNITGSARPGFDDYWTLTGLEPANPAAAYRR